MTGSPTRREPEKADAAAAAGIVEALGEKFVLVVGKGGVGKSTSAGALALHMADGGETVHLVSTDPAHSLGDLFGLELAPGVPTPSPCTPRLSLEEIDAAGRARAWLEKVRGPLAELVDLGTYLDRDDVASLLERSMPGMDELMGALRLVELADGDARVVVDTAPTGHLLRMLDSGEVLDGWSAAMAAMADKAGAVAAGLTGRRVRFAGEEVISRLRDQVVRFREQVLGRADFVVVTRSGDVVRAETLRLRDELGARGCRVRAVLDVGGLAKSEGAEATHTVPAADDLVGCDGLRAWGSPARTEGASPVPPDARRGAAITEALGGRSLYLFAGKGGVGKSTCAAAFGLALGQATGREVLLLGTDPAGSLGDVLGVPIGRSDTRVTSALVARELDAEAELEAFRERYRDRIRGVFRRLGIGDAELDRRVLESFIELAPPGIDEIFALDAILEQTGEQQVLVVDAAPTGHLLRLLEMPELARSWSHAVLGVLLKYRSVLGLDDFASQLLRFARRVDGLIELLRDDRRVGIVVVTLDGVLPGRETTRLARALHDADLPVAALVLNRSMGAPPEMEGGAARVVPLTIRAPAVDPPPVGPDRLVEFLDRWSVA